MRNWMALGLVGIMMAGTAGAGTPDSTGRAQLKRVSVVRTPSKVVNGLLCREVHVGKPSGACVAVNSARHHVIRA